MAMYLKNLCRRVTIRLSEDLAEWVTRNADTAGVTPSEWVRMILHSSMVLDSEMASKVKNTSTEKAGSDEDKKTDKQHLL